MNFDAVLPGDHVVHRDSCLKPTVELLDLLVNENFISSTTRSLSSLQQFILPKSNYSKLHSLIQFLKVNDDEDLDCGGQLFDLLRSTQDNPAIFHIPSSSVAKYAEKQIAKFHDSLLQIIARPETANRSRKRSRSPSREADTEAGFTDTRNDLQFRKHVSVFFDLLHHNISCGSHEIVLRPQKQLCGELDLFLSGCQNSELWQEVGCLHHKRGDPIYQIDNICESLSKFADQRTQLVIDSDAGAGKIYCSTVSRPRSHLGAKFSSSLDKLIQAGYLQEISLRNDLSVPVNIFSRKDKYALAYNLGICFLNFFDAGFMKQSWNSSSILFLVPKDQKTQNGFLYIRCSPRETYQEDLYLPGHPVLTSFAKLLLEIYCGEPFASENENLNHLEIWGRLCHRVAIFENLNETSYLKAVSGCLRLYQQLIALKDCQDADVKARELVYEEIIRHLESELGGPPKKRQFAKQISLRMHGKPDNNPLEDRYQNQYKATPRAETISRESFNVAIVCALPLEADAAKAVFDETYEGGNQAYGKLQGDENVYTTGRIGNYNIILCHLPAVGPANAASVTAGLHISYPCIQLTLVVGICGGVPFPPGDDDSEILLGDVIISDSLVKYDSGKQLPDKFQRKTNDDTLSIPSRRIQGLLKKLRTTDAKNLFETQTYQHVRQLQSLQSAHNKPPQYQHPGIEHDKLLPAYYKHRPRRRESLASCTCHCCKTGGDPGCDEIRKVDCDALGCIGPPLARNRHSSGNTQPIIHIGKIACADTVMKSGKHRDKIAKQEKAIGFEMEGAGVWSHGQCLIIKGVSDYSDSHKNNKWQHYAAATAAAGAKAFLSFWAANP
ncbi:hypothetical protein TWF718_003411 [Orbilia javanica]|uniref:Nucleoside phosphorylase domain-containing protein n=1 Tax=Orbilia javanica TaxID=47235 RepID=A0AAN8R908_9PEZI